MTNSTGDGVLIFGGSYLAQWRVPHTNSPGPHTKIRAALIFAFFASKHGDIVL